MNAATVYHAPVVAEGDTFSQVALADLHFGAYNRPVSEYHVTSLVAAYRDRAWAMPAIECNLRETGELVVINGQHRVEAAKLLGWATVPAIVHLGWTEAQEAQAFTDSAKAKRVGTLDLWHAARLAGQPDVLTVQALLDRLGLKVPRNLGGWNGTDHITCVGALMAISYGTLRGGRASSAEFKPERLERVLVFVQTTWPDDPHRFDNRVLRGLAYWFKRYEHHSAFNIVEASRKLSLFDCTDVLRRTLTKAHTDSVDNVVAAAGVLTGLYDLRRRYGRLGVDPERGEGAG